jgi:predicted esterase
MENRTMPTIANLPSADVEVTFPSGNVKNVNMIRLLVQAQNAEFKTKHGMFLPNVAKLHPTVKALREEYEIPAQTWAEAASHLRQLHTMLTQMIDEAREAQR